jgi:hypothetical protein
MFSSEERHLLAGSDFPESAWMVANRRSKQASRSRSIPSVVARQSMISRRSRSKKGRLDSVKQVTTPATESRQKSSIPGHSPGILNIRGRTTDSTVALWAHWTEWRL